MIRSVRYTPEAARPISKLPPELKKLVRSAIDGLREQPEEGTELMGELAGYRSVRVRRYRIIHKINQEETVLEILYFGHRRDIYDTLRELLTPN